MVTAIWLCRMICIATRGWTSRATSSEAHVRRVECAGIGRTPALAHRVLNSRWKLRGSTGSPLPRTHDQLSVLPGPACRLAPAVLSLAAFLDRRHADVGHGSGASDASVRATCSAVTWHLNPINPSYTLTLCQGIFQPRDLQPRPRVHVTAHYDANEVHTPSPHAPRPGPGRGRDPP
jgi:hypothetical protein